MMWLVALVWGLGWLVGLPVTGHLLTRPDGVRARAEADAENYRIIGGVAGSYAVIILALAAAQAWL